MYDRLKALMGRGYPVGIKFGLETAAPREEALFCELVQRARMGESVFFSGQGCPVGSFVLGWSESDPAEYYFRSGRYKTKAAASKAAGSIPRLKIKAGCIHLFPLKAGALDFDAVILFLTPFRAMQLIMALTYHDGSRLNFTTGGTASVCGDCASVPVTTHRLSISLGCKGSRKHSKYGDDEVLASIPFDLVDDIEEGLASIPDVYS